MNIAFILLGISFLSLGWYIVKEISQTGAKIGGWLLILSSFGNLLSGFFNTDPAGTISEKMTLSGQIHGAAAGLLGFMILATMFIFWQFIKQQGFKPFNKPILISTILVWTTEISLISAMGVYLSKTNGMLTPETPIGWFGRLVIICCAVWVIVCATTLGKIENIKVDK
ncbi:MAG: DUF998 domain-containing protein [Bacteroidales bacterium]|nr:DUF998 domain-containing protein [Bacteroidales bacterium]